MEFAKIALITLGFVISFSVHARDTLLRFQGG